MNKRETILSLIDDYARRGEETAFAHRRGLRLVRWSYRRVAETAWAFARELERRGVGRGERVLFWAENSPEWVAAFFGCVAHGVVVVPLDVESTPDFVERVRAQTEARLLLAGEESGRLLAGAEGAPVGALQRLPVIRLAELDEMLAGHVTQPFETQGISPEDIVEIIYTSGTTAEPRGVCLTHRNLLANILPLEEEMARYARWEQLTVHPLRFLNLLPLSHVFGQFMGILIPQLLGGEVHFHDSLNPTEVIDTIRKRRISVVVTVPRLLDTLREQVERVYARRGARAWLLGALERAAKWHFLRRWWVFRRVHREFGWKFWAFISGGAALAEETERFWRRLGFVVIQGYGMTETASLISVNHPFKLGRGSVGKSLPGQEVKLDEQGEILVRGANVSPGYWRNGLEPLTDAEGWLRTGDLGEQDAAGNIYFKGRSKETIVTAAGLNIYPEDLERALNAQPEIRLSAVVGIESARGTEPLAVLILRDPRAAPAEVVGRTNAQLARHQQIRHWHVWREQDFPRTATHKIRKREILASILSEQKLAGANGGAASASAEVSSSASLAQVVSTLVAHPSSLDASANLATDLKLDSLGRVELLSALEDRYQVELDEASFTAATTLGDIEKLIRSGISLEDEAGASPGSAAASGSAASETASSAAQSRYPYPEWAQRFPFTWLRLLLFYLMALPITRLLCWVRVRGRANLDALRERPALFVSNHITYFDHALILSALPGHYRRRLAIAMEGERLRRWRYGQPGASWWTRLVGLAQYYLVIAYYNTFPLPQKSGFRRSFAYAGESVDRGYSLLVFPEGTRTPDGRLNPFMRGTGLLAAQLGVPVVPLRIEGLYELKASGRRGFAAPFRVSVIFGEPVSFEADTDPAEIARTLEERVRALKPDAG